MVREVICTQVRDAVYFSLLVDETKDISKKEQMSIVLRYLQNMVKYMSVLLGLFILAALMQHP